MTTVQVYLSNKELYELLNASREEKLSVAKYLKHAGLICAKTGVLVNPK